MKLLYKSKYLHFQSIKVLDIHCSIIVAIDHAVWLEVMYAL